MKKVMGWTGDNADRFCWCIAIEKQIMKKTHSRFLGLSFDEENVPNMSSIVSADKEGWMTTIGMKSFVNTLYELDNRNNNGEPSQSPPQMPPLDIPCHRAQINAAENNRGEEATQRPLGDVYVALRRASSSVLLDKQIIHRTKTRSALQLQVHLSSYLNSSNLHEGIVSVMNCWQ
jgi:hypothetical protein